MIKAANVVKFFDDTRALDHFCTTIEDGSIYGLIGSNGSGKSTFLRLIAGVYRPDEGQVEIEDAPVFENPLMKDKVFFVSDEFYYFPQSTMDEMAAFYAKMYSGFSWERYRKVGGMFPIDPSRKINTFSKGMQRQTALILGLSSQAQYLLLDEAFDGLDPIIRTALRKILADDVARRGATVIITSHNLRELEDMCDHVGLMHKGAIVFERELDELKLGFCKVQAAFKPLPDMDRLRGELEILQLETRGSLLNMVVRGESGRVLEKLSAYDPLFAESLPLTLEEVFINEMEAIGYDYNNVIF
ncbi:MAG: ABC transporter ATP-binding protein [Clostridiales bacterium]|uniref:ABC-2 type transport system ATP-binding protein n=1 Tax=Harryflintia acetispora TaxID=1849041 RepID=A0A9X8UK60_9FIRM|nr:MULTISPECIES: ABC transporter ATP-binding protein [Oscillospiraceae]PWM34470.1 MAG: ABC transporter ATP-binding protein [Clostridiales bacterium]RGB68375.1 ABC transporter ATP-binding protein [Harryflintia acetispora]TCL43690.1 ABC-2 type transport system ATP-binding protein [Harryflintia acetispora]